MIRMQLPFEGDIFPLFPLKSIDVFENDIVSVLDL